MATAADVIKIARQYLGYIEGGGPDGRSGNDTIFGEWWGLNHAPWCDEFASFCLYRAGVPHGPKGSKGFAYCPSDQAWYAKQGRLTHTPQVGAQAFYGFGHSEPEHTGIVVKVDADGWFEAIEGNTSGGDDTNGGMVMTRRRHVSQTTGFGLPVYTAESTRKQNSDANRTKPKVPNQRRQLALSSPLTRGGDVQTVQQRLIAAKYLAKGQADGVYGPVTAAAVKRFQRDHRLTQDSVVGPNTWHALFTT